MDKRRSPPATDLPSWRDFFLPDSFPLPLLPPLPHTAGSLAWERRLYFTSMSAVLPAFAGGIAGYASGPVQFIFGYAIFAAIVGALTALALQRRLSFRDGILAAVIQGCFAGLCAGFLLGLIIAPLLATVVLLAQSLWTFSFPSDVGSILFGLSVGPLAGIAPGFLAGLSAVFFAWFEPLGPEC
jgi:hypothetical protein